MHYWVDIPTVLLPHLTPGSANAFPWEEASQGKTAQGHYQFRIDKLYLPVQVNAAGAHFRWERVPVLRWTALHHVGDEDLPAGKADGGQELFEKDTGWPHEGPALAVFLHPGPLANEHYLRMRCTLTGNRVDATTVQIALGTARNQLRNFFQAIHQAVRKTNGRFALGGKPYAREIHSFAGE